MSHEIEAVYTPGQTDLYACIFKNDSGTMKVHDVVADAWDVWADADIDDHDIALTEIGQGLYTANFPAAITTAGKYIVVVYAGNKDSAADDSIVGSREIDWGGTAEITIDIARLEKATKTLVNKSTYNKSSGVMTTSRAWLPL